MAIFFYNVFIGFEMHGRHTRCLFSTFARGLFTKSQNTRERNKTAFPKTSVNKRKNIPL